MLFSSADQLKKRKKAELIIFPFWQQPKGKQHVAKPAAGLQSFQTCIQPALDSGDFEGYLGETLIVYPKDMLETRCLLLGLGKAENISVDALRQAYAAAVKECHQRGVSTVNLVVPTVSELRKIHVEECLQGIAEGLLLTNYHWEKQTIEEGETIVLQKVCLVGILPKNLENFKEWVHIAEGVYLARDLTNGNADVVTPFYLAETARKIAQKFPAIKATILNKKKIEEEHMGLLLAVARGSSVDPFFITLEYKGYPGSKDHTVLIGKGVTFDTGGLNLKPTGSMETMRDDMAGAAVVLATIAAAAALKLKINLSAVVAATENAIDSKSYKPGDVYKGQAGISVEIANTDAEGRLTLADALSYSQKYLKPTRIIDLATLTGSMVVALGEGMSGLFCNDEKLATALLDAGSRTAELLWRMPLHAPYKEQLKSDIADLKNAGTRSGGAITAALFLQAFVQDIPWAHIDIAGTAFISKENGYLPKNGTGFGVRLLIDFLKRTSKKS